MTQDKLFTVDSNIVLKSTCLEDCLSIFNIIDKQRGYLGQWLPFVGATQDLSDTELAVRDMIENRGSNLTCSIFFQNSFVGLVGLKDCDFINKKTEIGYWLSEEQQHKGIVTKSCRALINYAFNELDMYRIQLQAAPGNTKSQAVARRLGFIQEGRLRAAELHERGFVDLIIFSLLRPEWEKQHEKFE